ncbi:LysR family transcriptional regulator [Actinomadura violacea]|uniref:LysR family transcriptional regulator n=1 Tax=Actinomadura violacea TaxID=2819934 RepID=A0ABS3SB72_9ACTN|nr:LysR family transcriptional regulator [Actinomadura violacea]MBO2465818.1 LysR family transcriptional regulator [Actinomadura violacea]
MELRQLRYLVAVAEEGGFTRAAARVRVAQPAVSQQIAQLEREVGAALFDRTGRRVKPTPAGEAFLPCARAALAAADAGMDAVAALSGELAGHLAVGTIPCPPERLLERLGRYRREHPKVRLTLRTGHPEALTAQVGSGELAAAVIGATASRLPAGPAGQVLRPTLASHPVEVEPLVLAVARDHRLAGAAEASLDDLRDEPVVTLTLGAGLRSVLEAACAAAGFVPDVRTETDDLVLLADLVAHGLGIALLPRSAAGRALGGLAVVPLRDAPERSTTLIWRRDHVPLPVRALLDLLRE